MNLNESNFTFDGRHCLTEFGCLYLEKKGHPVCAKPKWDEYTIPGESGTLLLADRRTHDTLKFDGTLYFTDDVPSQAAVQERLRRMSAWLGAGRRPLIFDYEPQRYYLAQLEGETSWDYKDWIDGGHNVAFKAQPYAYDILEATAQQVVTGNEPVTLFVPVYTGEPAPVSCEVANRGGATITAVTLAVGSKQVVMNRALALLPGETLSITMEIPIGATIAQVNEATRDALPHVTRFGYLTLAEAGQVTVSLTFASGTKEAAVTAHARGRWQ